MANPTLTIGKIEDDGDRILLYPADDDQVIRDLGLGTARTPARFLGGFHIIASPAIAKKLHERDVIEYEPFGVNFGWFVSRVDPHSG